MDVAKTKAFSDLSAEVRKRPGAAEEIDARRRAITAAVRLGDHIAVFDDDVVSLGPVDRDPGEQPA